MLFFFVQNCFAVLILIVWRQKKKKNLDSACTQVTHTLTPQPSAEKPSTVNCAVCSTCLTEKTGHFQAPPSPTIRGRQNLTRVECSGSVRVDDNNLSSQLWAQP